MIKFKKFAAMFMAATMMLSSTVMAMAASTDGKTQTGNITADGQMEGYVDTKILSVVLPVSTNAYNFYLDPQKLVSATNAAKIKDGNTNAVSNLSVESDATLLFRVKNASINASAYANKSIQALKSTSDKLRVYNKSSVDVDFSFEAKLINLSVSGSADKKVAVVENKSAFAEGVVSMYMSLNNSVTASVTANATSEVKALTEEGVTQKVTVGALKDAYEYSYSVVASTSAQKAYKYKLKDQYKDTTTGFYSASFWFNGGANSDADWKDYATVTPDVEITWSFEEHTDEPAAPADPTFTAGSNVGEILYAGPSITVTSIIMINGGTPFDALSSTTEAPGKYTVSADFLQWFTGSTVEATVSYSKADGSTGSAVVAVKRQ